MADWPQDTDPVGRDKVVNGVGDGLGVLRRYWEMGTLRAGWKVLERPLETTPP